MSFLKEGLQNIFGPRSLKSEKRVSIIGTRGSGKTTIIGCLDLTCQTLSAIHPSFKFRIEEKTSGIGEASSDLRQGRFPPITPPGAVYEADFILKWEGAWGSKIVRLPVAETAGEDIQKLIGKFQGIYQMKYDWRTATQLHEYVLSSNGFILICPVSRALIFGTEGREKEPADLPLDPDVNIARMLDAIYTYKERARSSRIEGIAVMLTKYDVIQPDAQTMGMDLYKPGGIKRFMEGFFPKTSAQLKYYGMEKVQFFPCYVQVERTEDGGFVKWPDGTEKIAMNPHRPRMPLYSEDSYMNLVDWTRETFAK